MTDPGLDPILTYLRQHAGRYSLPALREQLVKSGFDPAKVDEAMAVYSSEPRPAGRLRILPKTLLVVAVNAVLFVGIGLAKGFQNGDVVDFFLSFCAILVCVELVGGIVACFPAKSRSWGLALLLGLMFSVGLGILALSGFCLLTLAKSGSH